MLKDANLGRPYGTGPAGLSPCSKDEPVARRHPETCASGRRIRMAGSSGRSEARGDEDHRTTTPAAIEISNLDTAWLPVPVRP